MTSCLARRIALGVAIVLAIGAKPVRAQTGLESVIEQYSAATIQGYIQPLADVLVANLAGGYVAGVGARPGFSFSLELVAMGAVIDDALKVYDATTPPGFTPSTFQTATIFGGTGSTVQHGSVPSLSYRGSDGLVDADYFPTAAPQLRLGFAGTSVVIRYASSSMVPFLEEEDFPDLTLLGLGVQHSLNRYIPDLLFDLGVSGSYNSLKFGDIVDLSAISVGVHAGKKFGPLGLFAGIASDGGSMALDYTSTDPNSTGTVSVDLDVKRAIRFTGGASLGFGPLHVFGDASFGDVNTFSGGLRIGG